ncbi:MAG: 50S ribosomal protein L30 [Acidobacteria bacterium]|nr:50S ribosomal protein L30 [Acidobacteriota bacterium]MBI3657635.1 50S ribosomal protein L30 [Acidobacteriota bacterium]
MSETPSVQKKMIRIKYVRSGICAIEKHKRVLRGLGLRRLNQVVERVDTEAVRGMVKTIPYLVRILD